MLTTDAEYAAEQIADAVIDVRPNLVGVRPSSSVSRRASCPTPFRAAVRRGARTLHHSITSGQAQDIMLTVKDVGAVFEAHVAPTGIASKIPPKVSATLGKLASLPEGERAAWLLRLAGRVRTLAFVFLFLGIGLGAAAWLSAGSGARSCGSAWAS